MRRAEERKERKRNKKGEGRKKTPRERERERGKPERQEKKNTKRKRNWKVGGAGTGKMTFKKPWYQRVKESQGAAQGATTAGKAEDTAWCQVHGGVKRSTTYSMSAFYHNTIRTLANFT